MLHDLVGFIKGSFGSNEVHIEVLELFNTPTNSIVLMFFTIKELTMLNALIFKHNFLSRIRKEGLSMILEVQNPISPLKLSLLIKTCHVK